VATVALLGTLDTKGREYGYLKERLEALGVDACVIDAGILGAPAIEPDIDRARVAAAAGTTVEALVARGDRGEAVTAMADGAARIVAELHAEGRIDGILGLGGTGGTTLITHAMRGLPVGVPKLMVSTVASGDTRPYVGAVDIALMYSVVDISGINKLSARVLGNAAGAIAGMVTAPVAAGLDERPLIGATMFGVTTPCVESARARLEDLGYEVIVFHATGTGGQSMEALIRSGVLAGVLDITTTELADDLVGGVFSAGPDRLEAAGAAGIPQVVSLGALDMVNFGAIETVPEQFRDRLLHRHNATVTLMRTTAEECRELGARIAVKLSRARGPVSLFVPRGGVSLIDVPGEPFHDPDADEALFGAVLDGVGENVEVVLSDDAINDHRFAIAMADRLHELCGSSVAAS
jgi:uncharacterized protein (UPF0261 family)